MTPSLRVLTWSLVIAVAAVWLYDARIRRSMVDFGVYRVAAERAAAGQSLYREEDGHYKFKYLPAFAFAMAPFAALEPAVAKALWFAITVGLLVALLCWSISALPDRRLQPAWLVAITIVVMAKFYGHELTLGQSNILLATLLVGALMALQRGARPTAGALFGAAVFVKPYAVILLPWLAVSAGLQATVAAASVVIAGLLAPAVVYGWTGNIDLLAGWYRTVTGSTASTLVGGDSVSVAAMWGKWLGVGTPAATLAVASGLCLAGVAVAAWLKRRAVAAPEYLEVALLMLLIPLLSPQGWDYVLLLGTPAVVCLADRWRELSLPWRIASALALGVMGLAIYDVLGRELYMRFMATSAISVCAIVIALSLARLRSRALA